MRCYLFIEPLSRPGWAIRPVAFDDPDKATVPIWVMPTTRVLAWLAAHAIVPWRSGVDGKMHCRQLADLLGYWPEPIELDVELMTKYKFDDVHKLEQIP